MPGGTESFTEPSTSRWGDVVDLRFAEEAARGATALIHCAVPPYHQWGELLEKVNDGVLHAAKTSKAPLVVLDNRQPVRVRPA